MGTKVEARPLEGKIEEIEEYNEEVVSLRGSRVEQYCNISIVTNENEKVRLYVPRGVNPNLFLEELIRYYQKGETILVKGEQRLFYFRHRFIPFYRKWHLAEIRYSGIFSTGNGAKYEISYSHKTQPMGTQDSFMAPKFAIKKLNQT